MKKYLLQGKNSYKANLHCHTVISDGKRTPEEVKEIYKKLGYSIVAYTDHDVLIPHPELCDDTFLALNGFEVEVNEPNDRGFSHTRTAHICMIALDPDNITQPMWHRSKYLFGNAPQYRDMVKFDESEPDFVREYSSEGISKIMTTGREKGFFVTYNHPTWSLEGYEEYMGYHGMHAFEMFNGGCISCGFGDYNPRVYDDILRGGEKIFAIGADDNHNIAPDFTRRSDSGWAFTVIKADKLDYKTVTTSLERGNFYASEGPEIYDLYYEDGKVYVTSSDADNIICNYYTRRACIKVNDTDEPVTCAEFAVPEDCVYFRITVTDKQGKHACTNAYFVSDLIGE
jgi:hypothetical protein